MYHGLEGVEHPQPMESVFSGVAVICMIINNMQDITAALESICLGAAVTCRII